MADEPSVPETHPRHASIEQRHLIEVGVESGITSMQGLVAQGRGEAFDYLIGERTIESAREAERVAACHLLLADHAVLSVNGNVAALVPELIIELAEVTGADIEVNIFNRTEERLHAIVHHLRDHGATDVKGLAGDGRIPGLKQNRAKVDADGIYDADVVLVPLEDGNRAEALSDMGKTELVIDLNPLSRSAQVSAVPIVDNIVRALPNMIADARDLRDESTDHLEHIVNGFDREAALTDAENTIRAGSLELA